jgi:hypothetical protein
MAETRTEIIQDMFYSFNRDPHSSAGLVESFCKKSIHMDPVYMRKAVNMLEASHQYLPKFRDLEDAYSSVIPKSNTILSEDCSECRETGLVHSLFKKTERGRQEVGGIEQSPSGMYYMFVVGSCKCLNGKAYSKSYPPVDVPLWIKNLADAKGRDCLTTIEKMQEYCNREARK